MGYVEMGVKYAMGESSTLYRRRLHAQGYLCGDFKKHLTAASDSGHRGMDEPSLTRPLWAFVSARSLGSSHSPDRHLCGLQGSPQFVFRHKVVSVTTDLIRCNGRPVRRGRVVYFVQTATTCPRGFMWGLQEALDCRVSFWTPRVGRAFVDTAAWAFVSARSLRSSHFLIGTSVGFSSPHLFFWTQGGLRDHGPDTLKWATSTSWATCASTLYRRRLHAQGYLCGGFKAALDCRVRFWTPRVGRAFVDTAALGLVSARSLGFSHFWSSVVCLVPCIEHITYGTRAKGLFSRPSTKIDTWGSGPIDTRIDTRGRGPPLVALHC